MFVRFPRLQAVNVLVGVDHEGRDDDELLEPGAEGVPEVEHLGLRRRGVQQGLGEGKLSNVCSLLPMNEVNCCVSPVYFTQLSTTFTILIQE